MYGIVLLFHTIYISSFFFCVLLIQIGKRKVCLFIEKGEGYKFYLSYIFVNYPLTTVHESCEFLEETQVKKSQDLPVRILN